MVSNGVFNNNDFLYLDGYFDGTNYKSQDGIITYSNFCGGGGGNCLAVDEQNNCIKKISCSTSADVYCEYPFY